MQERLKQIAHYIDNYEKSPKQDVLNYYHIFEIIESSNINSIMEDIKKKKLKILFHPDLIAYIPEDKKKSFEILSKAVTDMENVFSNNKNKEIYDDKLEKANAKRTTETKTENFNNNVDDLNEFNDIIVTNIKKHGFKFTSDAINMIIKSGSFKGITSTDNCRNRAINLSRKKIEAILNCFVTQNSNFLNTNIINYYSFLMYQDSGLKEKMDAYINACTKTALKYNSSQVEYAIKTTLNIDYNNSNKDFYPGFTNEESARKRLNESVNPKDIILLSRVYLNINNHNKYQNGEISILSDQQIIKEFVNLLEKQLTPQEKNKHHR